MGRQYIDHMECNLELQLFSLRETVNIEFSDGHGTLPLKPITDLILKSNAMSLYSNLTTENFQEELLLSYI